MTPNPYRSAYEKALEDLQLITAQFERLETRKKHVENLITTLRPMVDGHASGEATASTTAEVPQATLADPVQAGKLEEPATSYSYLNVPAPLPDSDGDPFQRRVKTTFRFKGLAAQRSF